MLRDKHWGSQCSAHRVAPSRERKQYLSSTQKAEVDGPSSLATFAFSVWPEALPGLDPVQTLTVRLFSSVYRTYLMDFTRVSVQSCLTGI